MLDAGWSSDRRFVLLIGANLRGEDLYSFGENMIWGVDHMLRNGRLGARDDGIDLAGEDIAAETDEVVHRSSRIRHVMQPSRDRKVFELFDVLVGAPAVLECGVLLSVHREGFGRRRDCHILD